ncbi:MAG: HD domain-containing phosphohydrolase [Chloroflexia bacterium]
MAPIKRVLRFRPNLLSTFSAISFILILVLGISLAIGIQQKVEESAVHQQGQHAADLVNLYISPRIQPYELTEPWDINSARFRELDELIITTMLRDHVVRIKLWSAEGVVLYSDQPQLVGERFPLEEDQLEALVGHIHMEVTGLDSAENEFEREQFDRLLEIYVPFVAAGETEPGAVFEVYLDLDAVDALNSEVSLFTWSAVGIGFIILYASLFALVYKASRTLSSQNKENARLYQEASQRLAERLVIEQDLRDRVEFERLVMAISTNFINLGTHELDNGVRQALRAVGTYVDVDRCYVIRFDEGRSTTNVALGTQLSMPGIMMVTHEWCAHGVVPMMGVTKDLPISALPWSYTHLNQGEALHIPRVSQLPDEARAEREFFTAMASKSVLLVPMVYNKTLVGALGMDRTGVRELGSGARTTGNLHRDPQSLAPAEGWSEDSIGLLKIVGEILVNALERRRAEDAIRESEQRFRAVFESAAFAIAIVDKDGLVIEGNKPVQEILGYSGDELKRMTFRDVTHPEDVGLNAHYFKELFEGKRHMYSMEKRYIQKSGDTVWVNLLVSALRDARGVPQLAIAMLQDVTERKRSQEEIKRQIERLNALRTIDNAITSSFDLTQTLEVVLCQVTHQLNVDAASVLVLNQRTGSLEYAAGTGDQGSGIRDQGSVGLWSLVPEFKSLAGRAALERKMVQVPDLSKLSVLSCQLSVTDGRISPADNSSLHAHQPTTDNRQPATDIPGAYFALPLMAKGKVMGVLEVYHRTPLNPQAEWLHFLETLAGQTAIAVDNALLFQDLQRYNLELSLAYDTTLEGWSHALDLRDRETEGHTQRVTEMTVRLARTMGIDETALVQIRRGALLHDIGKMGIPDAILLKPGPLTDAEWAVMRLHPVYAYELLSPIAFLHPALDIPYCHHEKWDGTGYPRRLRGEGIPLAARIFAIIDVYDALRSDRPYRAAWPEEKVLHHIRSLAGTHFDPDVVDAFLKMDRSSYRRTPTAPELVAEYFGVK